MAGPYLLLRKFSGKSKAREYNWFIKCLRWILRMKPEQISVLPHLPEGNKIKFRRYGSLSEPMKYADYEGSEAEAILKSQVEQTASMIPEDSNT